MHATCFIYRPSVVFDQLCRPIPVSQVINFVCPVRGSQTQALPVVNPTNQQCRIRPVIEGKEWSAAPYVTLEPLQHKTYEVTYQPLTMTDDETKHQVQTHSLLFICSVSYRLHVIPPPLSFSLCFRDQSFSPSLMGQACCTPCRELVILLKQRTLLFKSCRPRLNTHSCSQFTTGSPSNSGITQSKLLNSVICKPVIIQYL